MSKGVERDKVEDYLKSEGWKAIEWRDGWRHFLAVVEREGQKGLLKMATESGVAKRTRNEVEWNRLVNSFSDEAPTGSRPRHLLPVLRREQNPSEAEITSHSSPSSRSEFSAKGDKPFEVPCVLGSGECEGLYWFVSEYVEGEPLAVAERSEEIGLLRSNLVGVVDAVLWIMNLEGESLLPKDLEDEDRELKDVFWEKLNGWTDETKRDNSQLLGFVKERLGDLKVAPSHGDFVPWHFLVDGGGNLWLVDGESAATQGPKFYDVAYFYHRVYTKLRRPDVAEEFLKIFLEKYDLGDERRAFEVVLAQRIIGGYFDGERDNVTSIELQEELEGKLLSGGLI